MKSGTVEQEWYASRYPIINARHINWLLDAHSAQRDVSNHVPTTVQLCEVLSHSQWSISWVRIANLQSCFYQGFSTKIEPMCQNWVAGIDARSNLFWWILQASSKKIFILSTVAVACCWFLNASITKSAGCVVEDVVPAPFAGSTNNAKYARMSWMFELLASLTLLDLLNCYCMCLHWNRVV